MKFLHKICEIRATTTLEMAFVFLPFIYVVLVTVQMGIYYITQSALDSGVNQTAASLRSLFSNATSPPPLPSAAALKAQVVNSAGAMISNDASLAVEIRKMTDLSAGPVPITDGVAEYGTASTNTAAGTSLALRATSTVLIFAPGFSAFTTVESSAIVHRERESE
jgi:Flp pilus assembly protein TadG